MLLSSFISSSTLLLLRDSVPFQLDHIQEWFRKIYRHRQHRHLVLNIITILLGEKISSSSYRRTSTYNIRVITLDDSSFYCRRLTKAIKRKV